MPELPSQWLGFLTAVDKALPEPLSLHCVGGFVVSLFYGLRRPTGDIDYWTAIPNLDLDTLAGRNSALAREYGVYLQRVTVSHMPDEYGTRLEEMFPGQFRKLRLFAPDPYDLILSKIERNSGKDRDDANYLYKTLELSSEALRQRFHTEMRINLGLPEREELTLKLWIEIFEAEN